MQLLRPGGTMDSPTVYAVNGVAANYLTRSPSTTTTTTMTATKELAVPRSSQMIHRASTPSGAEAARRGARRPRPRWSCATSARARAPRRYSWSPYTDSFVDHAARDTFDYAYDGTGNWPFNTAYAGRYSLDSFVTRLHNLRDAEAFIKAGIPLVASIAFSKGGLDGAPISSTPGHLLVIRGFTAGGRVIANDPAASTNSTVRRIYSRAQFERRGSRAAAAWSTSSVPRPERSHPTPPAGRRAFGHFTLTLILG